ncbi:hypothetical protein [Geminocystis sp. NIES-3709]|uniref:hypothetical protein n=1 Tax=Geminocystis sp. NIES-3709 TaxID=1617448 RepID=UPI0005FC8664|nr:hypothetical protein [Geminocystis sp. NIES-3709]BAQ67081.1 hypothetical protein GM3709_3846 [Geminocystis sp. NIES-3709]
MIIYFGNTARKEVIEWHKNYGNVGTLISIKEGEITPPTIPLALDNGAFSYYLSGENFDFDKYFQRLNNYLKRCINQPDWLLIPDMVGNKQETIARWNYCYPFLQKYNLPLAFAVQDGMDKHDVPKNAEVIFIGGSTNWKLSTASYWTAHFPKVHMARVNAWNRLCYCLESKINSVDGTGFFRGGINSQQSKDAELFLRYQKGLVDSDWNNLKVASPSKRKLLLQESKGELFDIYTLPIFRAY